MVTLPDQGRPWFRWPVALLSIALLIAAAWTFAPEIYSSQRFSFPLSMQEARDMKVDRSACSAAAVSFIRGDLWANCALPYVSLFWFDGNIPGNSQSFLRDTALAGGLIRRSLTLSPHDARMWLLLAAQNLRLDDHGQYVGKALRMSYYTGSDEPALIPLRLWVAVHSPDMGDPDLQELVRHDLLVIVKREPELEPAISSAFRSASPVGRQVLKDAVQTLDPGLSAKLP